MLSRRREGAQVFYKVLDASFTDLCRTVCVRVAAELEGNKSVKRSFREFIKELG